MIRVLIWKLFERIEEFIYQYSDNIKLIIGFPHLESLCHGAASSIHSELACTSSPGRKLKIPCTQHVTAQ